MTGAVLAEAGRDVLMLEEGADLALDAAAPFSCDEMLLKYRNAGVSVALGNSKLAWVEGRCVGGEARSIEASTTARPNTSWRSGRGVFR
ncbi:hypothetical protein ACFSHP_22645 [Novosphingobium panipatense]